MRINREFSRRFLIAASAYRRHAAGFHGDFSAQALKEQFEHETHGRQVSIGNGFSFGKSALGITLAAMYADHSEGLFTKAELARSSCAFVRREIKNWLPKPFFGHSH